MAKLKPIPKNTVVHTPTEEEAKELLAILHENGYKWYCSDKEEGWDNFGDETCYRINSQDNVYHTCNREWYETTCVYCRLPILALAEFKSKYCEDDKPQPKFKVGDRVKVANPSNWAAYRNAIGKIIKIYDFNTVAIEFPDGHSSLFVRDELSILEPYTEPETKPTEDMETEELNLVELLKGHEGETFFAPICGTDIELKSVHNTFIVFYLDNDNGSTIECDDKGHQQIGTVDDDGKFSTITYPNGACMVYPSRVLYEQYPLDAARAWYEWQEEQKKHWLSLTAWIDDLECESDTAIDTDKIYFRTASDRDKCIEEIKQIIKKYSK